MIVKVFATEFETYNCISSYFLDDFEEDIVSYFLDALIKLPSEPSNEKLQANVSVSAGLIFL